MVNEIFFCLIRNSFMIEKMAMLMKSAIKRILPKGDNANLVTGARLIPNSLYISKNLFLAANIISDAPIAPIELMSIKVKLRALIIFIFLCITINIRASFFPKLPYLLSHPSISMLTLPKRKTSSNILNIT